MWHNNSINLEFLGTFNIYVGILIQIGFALLVGIMIGVEREVKRKPAGIKTNIMICLGATLYTTISLLNSPTPGMPYDPNRMAAQIVSGIGFLGAGAILRGGGTVSGLTTAATIWVVAALGVTIGYGYPILATIIAVVVLTVLLLINPLYDLLAIKKSYHLNIVSDQSIKKILQGILLSSVSEVLKVEEVNDEDNEYHSLDSLIICDSKSLHRLIRVVGKIKAVKSVDFKVRDDID